MKPATLIGSAALVVHVNLVPYLCRLPRGVRWAAQYLPDEGHLVRELLFFGAFASLPAIPLIVVLVQRKRLPIYVLGLTTAVGSISAAVEWFVRTSTRSTK